MLSTPCPFDLATCLFTDSCLSFSLPNVSNFFLASFLALNWHILHPFVPSLCLSLFAGDISPVNIKVYAKHILFCAQHHNVLPPMMVGCHDAGIGSDCDCILCVTNIFHISHSLQIPVVIFVLLLIYLPVKCIEIRLLLPSQTASLSFCS